MLLFTSTNRILFVFPFLSQWGLDKNIPNLQEKTAKWRILVVVLCSKWRHCETSLLSDIL